MSESITLVPGALSLDTLRSIYRGRPALTLDPAAYPRMERSRALIDKIAGADRASASGTLAAMSNLPETVVRKLAGDDKGPGAVAALLAALVLGLVNALIRPVAILLTLPATILTLGLFIFVINGLLFWWVGSFLEGFRVSGFWPGFFGAIVYSLISWAIGAIVLPGPRPSEPPAPGAR